MTKMQTHTKRVISLLVTVLMTCAMLVGTPFCNETAAQAAETAVVKAAFNAQEINGTYYLKNKATGTYLYALGTTSKSDVALGAKKTTAAYKMKITPVTAGNAQKGSYITPTSGSVVLNPFSDTPTNGTAVNLYTKNTDGTQYWIFEPVTGGYYLHNSYNTNLVLNSTGTSVNVATKANSNAQIWVLESTAVTLSSISITKKPTKLTYNIGETLNTAGLTLKLTYSDGTTKTVTSGFKATADLSTVGTKTVTVSYTESGVTKTATFNVTVNAVLSGIKISQMPNKTAYSAGETLDTTGMKVTASYTGAADKDVTASVKTTYDFSQSGTKTVTVSYTENSVTKTATFTVTVDAVLSGIKVTHMPGKTVYSVSDTLDTTGMKITASYIGAADRDVTASVKTTYDFSQAGTKTVTVSYTENGVTKTASFTVTVNAVLTGIKITQMPGKTAYSAGETLDLTGMKVTASYTGAADKDVTASVKTTYDFSQAGTKTVTVSYTENGVTKTAAFNVTVSAVLSGIKITQMPNKTAYSAGDTLNTTGMKVTASYTGAADKDVTASVKTTYDFSQSGSKTVTVSYTENGVTKTASFTVTVDAVLTGIKITQMPSKTAYSAGDTLNTTGMKITASYTGAADREVTASVKTTYDFSQAGTKTVTVSYTENGVTKTATFTVTVSAVLSGITIAQMPDKTAYSAGNTLNTTGMKITASYTGAADKDVTASVKTTYDFSQAGTKTVTVSYTENGVTKTATFEVTVSAVLSGLKVTQMPSKTTYSAGETLNTTGMKVTASYTGAADKDVTASVQTYYDLALAGSKNVTLSYTENGVTKTASFTVTVNAVLTGIKLTQLPDKTEYFIGEELDTTGMKVTASYRGAADKDVTASVTTESDFSALGEAVVTVKFGGCTAKFTVNVNSAPDAYFRGEGTVENPFLISSKTDLETMRDLINDCDTNADYGTAYYKQTADIDLGGENWMPIGKRMKGSEDWGYGFFNGSYDGDYHKIIGLNVVSSTKYSGLFGSSGPYAVVKNLHVEGNVKSTRECTGGIIGEINNTVISNCTFIGNVTTDNYIAGGIVGNFWQGGTLVNCYHIGTVKGSRIIGGLAGYVCSGEEDYAGDMTFENCYHVGKVEGYEKIGSAFGEVLIGKAYPITMTVQNVYVCKDDASKPLNGSGFSGSVNTVTDSEMKQSAEALGDAYVNDPDMLNNGYPMFPWELQVAAGGRITAQPQNQMITLGNTATFSVTVDGEGLTYQWQYNTGSGWYNSGMTGNQTEVLSVEATEARNGQQYRCVITNSYGISSVSAAAVLTVAPKITTQPAGLSVPIGDTAILTVAAEGSGLTYQWQYYDTNVYKWLNSGMTGNKTAALSVEATQARHGQKYRCIVTNSFGNQTVSAETALSVSPKITTQPVNKSGAIGETVIFTVTAKGTDLSYQWQFKDGATWKDSGMTGNQTAVLSVPVTAARDGQQYRCVVKSTNGTDVTSAAVKLTVKAAVTRQPVNASAAEGEYVRFTVEASGVSTLSYQWQFLSNTGWKDSGMTGAKTPILSVPVTAERNGQQYRCIVTAGNGATATSNAASVKVKISAAIMAQPTTQELEIGQIAKFTVDAKGENLTYQWQFYSNTGWKNSGMTGANTDTLSVPVTAERNGQQYRCIVTASGKTLTSESACIKVKTSAAITSQPTTQTLPIGQTAKFTVAATGTNLTYQWQFLDGANWKNSGMTGANTATLSVPVTASRDGQQYRCLVTASGKTLTSEAASIKVKAAITTQPTNQTGKIDTTVKFTVAASGTNLKYQWQFLDNGAWKNSGMTGANTVTLSVPVTAARDGQQYKCVVTSANGTSATTNAVKLIAGVKITAQPKDYTGNIGTDAKFTVAAVGNNLSYQWQFSDNGVWKDSGMTGAKTATLSVPITAARNGQKYRCVVKSANGTSEESVAVTLKTGAAGITGQPQNATGKVGDTVKFTVTASNATYQWQFFANTGWQNSGMTGAQTTTISVPVTEARDGQKYRCIVKFADGSTQTSNEVSLKVQAAITTQPQNASGKVGETAKFTVAASGTNLTYQWQFYSSTGWQNSGMTGAKTASISVPITDARNGQQYRCIVTSANGTSATSNAAKLTVTK